MRFFVKYNLFFVSIDKVYISALFVVVVVVVVLLLLVAVVVVVVVR